MTRSLSILCVMLISLCGPAMAATLQWSLENAQFNDGGSIVGSFQWDTVSQQISNIEIRTTAGATPFDTGHDYAGAVAARDVANDPDRLTFRTDSRLLVLFGSFDLDTAGTIALQGSLNGFYECFLCEPFRHAIGGATLVGREMPVSPVPLPAALPILLTALGAMGALRLRRRR